MFLHIISSYSLLSLIYLRQTDIVPYINTDIDECRSSDLNTCDINARCDNTMGSFVCTCNPGFTSDDMNGCIGQYL